MPQLLTQLSCTQPGNRFKVADHKMHGYSWGNHALVEFLWLVQSLEAISDKCFFGLLISICGMFVIRSSSLQDKRVFCPSLARAFSSQQNEQPLLGGGHSNPASDIGKVLSTGRPWLEWFRYHFDFTGEHRDTYAYLSGCVCTSIDWRTSNRISSFIVFLEKTQTNGLRVLSFIFW